MNMISRIIIIAFSLVIYSLLVLGLFYPPKNLEYKLKTFICNVRIILKFIYNNKKTIILFIIGILFLSWLIYNRIFRTRISRDLVLEYDLITALLYSYFFLLNMVLLVITIIVGCLKIGIINIKRQPKYKPAWFRYLRDNLNAFSSIYTKALETVYFYTIKTRDFKFMIMDSCCALFLRYQFLVAYSFISIILLCQLIVVVSFSIDVFYFSRFYWFYKFLILLLGPLISKVLLYFMKDYAEEGMQTMEKYVTIVHDKETDTVTYTYRDDISKDYERSHEDLAQIQISHSSLELILELISYVKYHITLWYIALIFQGCKYSLYCITWGYLLFCTIN